MNEAAWKQAKQVFHEALERDESERNALLASACGEDRQLLARVQSLLAAHDEADGFLTPPTVPAAERSARAAATPGDSPPTEQPGAMIGDYKLLQIIGEGGCGIVYMAEQQQPVRRTVALKIIKPGMDTRRVIARFETERQALALMEHPNIARVLEAGATGMGRPYFVMELIRGVPITDYCDSRQLTTAERLELFSQVCSAVQHAHQKGIIHRDLKPSNVMVTLDDSPEPKVIDFGIAKATDHHLTGHTQFTEIGHCVGTPAYMSPEQAEMDGLDVDTRSDVYSLGVLLYELLTGTTPFSDEALAAAGHAEVRRMIREDDPPTPSTRLRTLGGSLSEVANQRRVDPGGLSRQLRGDLDWIVMRALEKDRQRRYSSPAELAADIERHMNHEPVLAGPPGATYRARKFIRRHWFGVSASVAILLALVAGLATASWGLVEARRANVRAEREAAAAERVSEFLVDLFEVSDPSEARGSTITAREMLDKATDRIGSELADDPLLRARLLHTLGRVYRNLGLYEPAEQLLGEAFEIRRELLGVEVPDTISTQILRARLSIKRGESGQAEATYREALEWSLAGLGPEHRATLELMNGLGNVLRMLDRPDEAEAFLVPALDGQRRLLGDGDIDTIKTIVNLGVLRLGQARYDEARDLLTEGYSGMLAAHGDDHPATLITMECLAGLSVKQGRYEEAERLYTESLELRRGVLSDEHPDTLTSKRYLANLYRMLGRTDEAETLFLETLETQRRVMPLGNNRIGITLTDFGVLYLVQDRYDEAEAALTEALAVMGQNVTEEHVNILVARGHLAQAWAGQGRLAEAEALLLTVLEAQTRKLGERNLRSLTTLGLLAQVYAVQDRPLEAEDAFRRVVEATRCTLREDHPRAVGARRALEEFLATRSEADVRLP